MTRARLDAGMLVLAMAAWLIVAALQLGVAPALGHDEAAYVLGARRLLGGDEPLWLYRSVGTELLAVPGVVFGDGDTAIRITFVIAGCTVPLGAYALARVAFPDAHVAGWTAMILAGAHRLVHQNTAILGDLPAAGLLLVALAILIRELSRPDGPTWSIVAAAPALVVAFYLRHGSVPALLMIAVACLVIYPRAIMRRPMPVIAMTTVATILVVPHLWSSMHHTGSPFGVLAESARATRLAYVGEGLVTYVTSNPFDYYGLAMAPLLLVGIAMGVAREPAARFLAIIAIGTIVLLGIRSHAQPRYIFIALCLLSLLGTVGLHRVLSSVRARIAATIIALVSVLVCVLAAQRFAAKKRRFRATFVELGPPSPATRRAGHAWWRRGRSRRSRTTRAARRITRDRSRGPDGDGSTWSTCPAMASTRRGSRTSMAARPSRSPGPWTESG